MKFSTLALLPLTIAMLTGPRRGICSFSPDRSDKPQTKTEVYATDRDLQLFSQPIRQTADLTTGGPRYALMAAAQEANNQGGAAQHHPPTSPKAVLKVVPVRYANVEHVARLVGFFGAAIRPDPQSRVITVAGDPAAVAAVVEAVKKLDVPPPPPRDVILTAYVLVASRQGGASRGLPSSLRGPIAQIKRVLDYKTFRLVNTLMLRLQDGSGGSISGAAMIDTGTGKSQPATFRFGAQDVEIASKAKSQTVGIRRLSFLMVSPSQTHGANDARIDTGVDIPAGVDVVVGKSPVSWSHSALILIVSAAIAGS
jgi:hypothetical protein